MTFFQENLKQRQAQETTPVTPDQRGCVIFIKTWCVNSKHLGCDIYNESSSQSNTCAFLQNFTQCFERAYIQLGPFFLFLPFTITFGTRVIDCLMLLFLCSYTAFIFFVGNLFFVRAILSVDWTFQTARNGDSENVNRGELTSISSSIQNIAINFSNYLLRKYPWSKHRY